MNEKIYLTPAQMAAAAPYEANMATAVKSDWTRGLGRNGAKTLAQISKEVAGGSDYIDITCPGCVLNLVRRVGRWYFDTKERDAALALEAEQKRAAAKVKADLKAHAIPKVAPKVAPKVEASSETKAAKAQKPARTPKSAAKKEKTVKTAAPKKSAAKSAKKAK